MQEQNSGFSEFYREVFLQEHQHPFNVALHVLGTVTSTVYLVAVIWLGWPWLALLYPVVHAAPGLIGHRIFERNEHVGDLRVTRKDFSPLWFIAGNYLMTLELAYKGFHWRKLV